MALPRDAKGSSAVCDCGISWPYSDHLLFLSALCDCGISLSYSLTFFELALVCGV